MPTLPKSTGDDVFDTPDDMCDHYVNIVNDYYAKWELLRLCRKLNLCKDWPFTIEILDDATSAS